MSLSHRPWSQPRAVIGGLFVLACVLFPALSEAQSSVAGVVRDASGAVLPGVTVEAAGPVLIEKIRTAVTDGGGQYRITELPPGTYTLTFSLAGFAGLKRDGLEVSGSGATISINADLRVGGLQETVNVTGETPVVDVQSSTRRQTVLDDSVVTALPASRGYGNLLATLPEELHGLVVFEGRRTVPRSRRQLDRAQRRLQLRFA